MKQEEVLALLRESGALLEGHFQLSSGLRSDRYFQCARVLMDPARAERLARALAERLPAGIDLVLGPALGAVVWAHEVARAIGVRSMFTERDAGDVRLRRGFEIAPGERVLLVEDVVTTGRSLRETLEVVREQGGQPVCVGAIVDRSAGDPFAGDGLELVALARVQARTWSPDETPAELEGVPAVKPGSRAAGPAGGAGG